MISKRTDGFHDLETVFYPVPLRDIIEIITRPAADFRENPGTNDFVVFSRSGLTIAGNDSDNLCLKAFHLLKNDFPDLPAIKLHLHKVIPMGAGLGGGSADGAFTLRLLNEIYQLNLTNNQLISYAVMLGSDCPFFIINRPCFASSRGEMMETIPLDLSGYTIVLVNCGIHINTGWAFSQLGRSASPGHLEQDGQLKDIIQKPVETWTDALVNDFEQPVFKAYPAIKNIKDDLYRQGAIYASMSGSGSTVFGIFPKTGKPRLEFPEGYAVMIQGSDGF